MFCPTVRQQAIQNAYIKCPRYNIYLEPYLQTNTALFFLNDNRIMCSLLLLRDKRVLIQYLLCVIKLICFRYVILCRVKNYGKISFKFYV